jgi:peptide deformylase
LIARAARIASVPSEIALCSIMSIFAQRDRTVPAERPWQAERAQAANAAGVDWCRLFTDHSSPWLNRRVYDEYNFQMRLKIVQAGEAVLRRRARELSIDEIRSRETQNLIEWMRETMYDAPGVGLAAPQIGLGLQLAVIEDKPEYTKDLPPSLLKERERKPVPFQVIVNPKITLQGPPEIEFFEGCLSLAAFTAVVPRARRVKVDYLDHHGQPGTIEASGWHARILQHEIDHLQGTVYIDRMYPRTFMSAENYNRYWKDKPVSEALKLAGFER